MLVADGQSHLLITKDTHINLDLHIHIVPFSEERLSQVREETASDTILTKLKETILVGWPHKMKDLPKPLRLYRSFRVELSVEKGLLKVECLFLIVHSDTYCQSCMEDIKAWTKQSFKPKDVSIGSVSLHTLRTV